MRTLVLIFACKRPKYVDTGGSGSQETVKFLRTFFMDAPYFYPISFALFKSLFSDSEHYQLLAIDIAGGFIR